MVVGEAVIVAGIGSRKGVSAAEVVAAVDAALKEYGLERGSLTKLATTEFKRGEEGIFEAGEMMGLEVVVVEIPPPLTPPHKGEGDHAGALAKTSEIGARETPESPSPLWGGVRGGGALADGLPVTKTPSPSRANALDTFPPEGGEEKSLSFTVAGVESISEAAALAAAGEGARLAGPRIAVGRVTCAIAFGGGR
jgi:cobalt-precorrin 5A hydrolase